MYITDKCFINLHYSYIVKITFMNVNGERVGGESVVLFTKTVKLAQHFNGSKSYVGWPNLLKPVQHFKRLQRI